MQWKACNRSYKFIYLEQLLFLAKGVQLMTIKEYKRLAKLQRVKRKRIGQSKVSFRLKGDYYKDHRGFLPGGGAEHPNIFIEHIPAFMLSGRRVKDGIWYHLYFSINSTRARDTKSLIVSFVVSFLFFAKSEKSSATFSYTLQLLVTTSPLSFGFSRLILGI